MGETERAWLHPVLAMVTDRRRYSGAADGDGSSYERVLKDTIVSARAGVDLIQIRERGLDDRDLVALTARIAGETSGSRAKTIVNDRLDVALAAGADGVHLPARGMAGRQARAIAPAGFVIGRSVHSEEEAEAAARDGGCDYLIFGSVFESAGKPAGHPVAGVGALGRVCAKVALPVLAIGGITRARLREVAAVGAAGIAAIGLFVDADPDDLAGLVEDVRSAFRSM